MFSHHIASTWAVPEIRIDGELMECYVMQSEKPNWDSKTYWPQEALDILNTNYLALEYE